MTLATKSSDGKSANFEPSALQLQFCFAVHDADAEAVKKKMLEKRSEEKNQKQEQDVISGVQMPGGWTVTASGTNREAIAADGQNADLLPSRPSSAVPVRTVWLFSVFHDDVVDVFFPAMELAKG